MPTKIELTELDALISRLSKASDLYGSPYLTGFMDKHSIVGLCECYENQRKYTALARAYLHQMALDTEGGEHQQTI